MVEIVLLCLGLFGLWASTELAIQGALRISEYFGLSQMFIGLTILAFGTDLPELVVSVSGAIRNLYGIESSGVIVGNAVGSSLCQISIVLGTAAICHQLTVQRRQIGGLSFGLLGSCVLLFLVGLPGFVWRPGGIVLVSVFIGYLVVLYRRERDGRESERVTDRKQGPIWRGWIFVVVGLAVLIFSSELVVQKALQIVERFDIRQSFVGAVIVAFGTSLPELALTVTAALKNKPGLSLGNIVGSNVFDCLIPVGVAACIAPLEFDRTILRFDLPYLFVVSGVFTWFLCRRAKLHRHEGAWLCVLYFVYVALKIGAE